MDSLGHGVYALFDAILIQRTQSARTGFRISATVLEKRALYSILCFMLAKQVSMGFDIWRQGVQEFVVLALASVPSLLAADRSTTYGPRSEYLTCVGAQ